MDKLHWSQPNQREIFACNCIGPRLLESVVLNAAFPGDVPASALCFWSEGERGGPHRVPLMLLSTLWIQFYPYSQCLCSCATRMCTAAYDKGVLCHGGLIKVRVYLFPSGMHSGCIEAQTLVTIGSFLY